MTNSTAHDCQRLLTTQPLLEELHRLDLHATAENLTFEVTCCMDALLRASVIIARAGQNHLLATVRADIDRYLPRCEPAVAELALHAAVARAFADVLDEQTIAQLSLPWALAAVVLTDADLTDRMFDAIGDDLDVEFDDDEL